MTKEEFRQIREGLGVSLREVARALDMSPRGVRYYEDGERPISGSIARHMREFRDGKPL